MLLREINEVLIKVSKSIKISAIKSEAISITKHEMSYKFVLNSVIW